MLLTESEVTRTNLINIFNAASMSVTDEEEGKFSVQCDNYNVTVDVDDEHPYLNLKIIKTLKNIEFAQALLYVNDFNHNFPFGKLYVKEFKGGLILWADYHMSTKNGLIKSQLVSNVKLLDKATEIAISDYFLDYVYDINNFSKV